MIDDSKLKTITERLIDEFHPYKIILFGSHAWGIPNKESDIDICILVEKSNYKPSERMRQAYRCLQGLDISKDVLVKTRDEYEKFQNVPSALEYKISEKGKVLYG